MGLAGVLGGLSACGSPAPAPRAEAPPRPPVAPSAPPAPPAPPGLRFDVGAVDRAANPCTSFYDFACGTWRKTHPIPPEETKISRYAELSAKNLERSRAIVEEARALGASGTPDQRLVGDYYAACLDQTSIDAKGTAPLAPITAKIRAARSPKDLALLFADLHAHGVSAGFSIAASPDPHDASRVIAWLDKGAMGMPDPGDYTKSDDDAVARRTRYTEHLGRLYHLLGDDEATARATAARVLALEITLAARALSRAERRQREKLDHPMTVAELSKRYPSIDWPSYFGALGLSRVTRVNVAQPAWLDGIESVLSKGDLPALRDQVRMRVVRSEGDALPAPIYAELFDFTQRTLRGAKEMSARPKVCTSLLDDDLGQIVGRVFVARHFDAASKSRVTAMIAALERSFRADFDASDWLSPSARSAAKQKLDKMLVVVGASNRSRSFDGLVVDPTDAFGNAWRARALTVADELAQVDRPVDRETFFEALPQELDGFGSKTLNATGFTAGFLQPPVFDPTMDDAVNYGAVGSVIGHELSHQFDDEGRKYDGDGALHPWWDPEDVRRFEERAQCFVDEYARFAIEDGTHVDGRLTLGENIADNGGIRLSFDALRPSEAGPLVDGFTPAQRFFLAWAQIRCENVTPERARRLVETDEHAPGRFRVDGVVSNMPELARAFSCAKGTPMNPERRCRVW